MSDGENILAYNNTAHYPVVLSLNLELAYSGELFVVFLPHCSVIVQFITSIYNLYSFNTLFILVATMLLI